MPATRKYHRKTKTGCIPCKNRHSKCDELKPRCSGCIRHQTACVYPSSSKSDSGTYPLHDGIENNCSPKSQEEISEINTGSSAYPQGPTFHLLNVNDLRNLQLLHHYTTATYATMSCNRQHDQIWQKTIPSLACDCPYLMHGILAVAALHLAHLKPEESSLFHLTAARNQDLALPQYRAAVSVIKEGNGPQIFAFSNFIIISAIVAPAGTSSSRGKLSPASNQDIKETQPSNSAEWIFDWMRTLRGVRPIVDTLWTSVCESSLGPLVQDYFSIAENSYIESNEDDTRLEKLLELLCPPQIDTEDLDAWRFTISGLRRIFRVSRLSSEQKSLNALALSWPPLIPQRLFTFFEARKPVAMIILSYYAVFLLQLDSLWWIKEAPAHFVNECRRSLEAQDAAWALPWIEWPMQRINAKNKVNSNATGA